MAGAVERVAGADDQPCEAAGASCLLLAGQPGGHIRAEAKSDRGKKSLGISLAFHTVVCPRGI